MQILIPRFSLKHKLNQFWQAVRGTPIGALMTHEAQGPLAYDFLRHYRRQPSLGEAIARRLFAQPLRGAGYGWESRRNLQPASDATIATTGANTVNFNLLDFLSIQIIGFAWSVAGTVTALVMDFDFYPVVAAVGTVVDKLDTVNGVITAPTVAGQAIGNVLYKDLGDLIDPINVSPNDSIQAIVTTTTTAGNGLPFIIGFARAETFANLTGAIKSS